MERPVKQPAASEASGDSGGATLAISDAAAIGLSSIGVASGGGSSAGTTGAGAAMFAPENGSADLPER